MSFFRWFDASRALARETLMNGAEFETASVPMIVLDLTLTVKFINPAFRDLMLKNPDVFRAIWSTSSPEMLVGRSLRADQHTGHPLPDLSRVPHRSDISIGDLKFVLSTKAVINNRRRHVGTIVEWIDVSQARVNAGVIEALHQNQALLELSLDSDILSANQNALSILGYRINEVRGQALGRYGSEEAGGIADPAMWDRLRNGESASGKFALKTRSGSEAWFSAILNPVCDQSKAPIKIVALMTDVTEIEMVAYERSSVIAAIASQQCMIECDPQGRILRANRVFLAALGYDEGETIGRQHSIFLESAFANSPEHRLLWEKLASGEAVAATFRYVSKSGALTFLQGSYLPVRDRSNNVGRVVMLMSDITAAETTRRSLEAAMRDQAAIIEAISGGLHCMVEFDVKGNILDANQNFLDTVGYSMQEVVGQNQSLFVDKDFSRSKEYRMMWERIERGESFRGTFKRIAKGGRVLYLDLTYNPVRDESGKVVRVVKVASDVTVAETERLESIRRREGMEAEQAIVVDRLSAALSRLAEGDLGVRLSESFAQTYEDLRGNFNAALEKLEGALSAVTQASDKIRTDSTNITRAADDLLHRTENQAAALEETAASLEQLTASVKVAAASAEKASGDVEVARRKAEESERIVREAVDAMGEIEKSSDHISQIIGVIDDIAFQTSLLALNAGVEAARAGDAGRGFAVVASEVRALAQRSSDAAKEIKALISTSSQHVGHGVDLVRETGRSLEAIMESVSGITSLVGDIAHSSREQALGLTEINTAVGQLDQVTQQNAAMVEESTSASHAMRSEAESLTSLVAQFKTNAPQSFVDAPGPHGPVPFRRADETAHSQWSAAGSARLAGRPVGAAVRRRQPIEDWTDF